MNCKAFFGLDDQFFKEKDCINTASEIAHQPALWKELGKMLVSNKKLISDFMESFSDLKNMRIILTGAGSSAFIGEALAGFIAKSAGIRCEAIHTTDIVSAPDTVLFADTPTLMVSFARSGNSPESAGTVQYARKIVKNLFEVAIVCDDSSELHRITAESKKSLILVMPEGSNDKGFAMTSSVSCMMLTGFALFNYRKIDDIAGDIARLSENVEHNSFGLSELALKCAENNFDRVVYLGSGAYKGLAHEGSLKMMELSNGTVNASFDSAAGFRHGPKTVIKDSALSLHLISSDPFTAKYDLDLLKELFHEKNQNKVIAVCGDNLINIEADEIISLVSGGYGFAADICIGINGLVFFQMFAMHKSLSLGITTDNPSPGGQVNRVVKGVTVYPL